MHSTSTPKGRPPAGITFRDRLLSGIVIDLDALPSYDGSPCWMWTRRKRGGYGLIKQGTKSIGAHVAAFELFRGPLPEGAEPDHRCHDPEACKLGEKCPHRACCNPWHMEPVPHRVNVLRGGSFAAEHAKKDRCPQCQGEYEPDGRDGRYCPRCTTWEAIRAGQRQERAAKRANETPEQAAKREYNRQYYRMNRERLLQAQKERDTPRAEEKKAYNKEYYRRNYDRFVGGGGVNGDLFYFPKLETE